MIRSLLVANRGEIACRIFRTARRLGVRTVAVYSDADARAQHVRAADEAWRIGPAAARASYLDITAVLAAAQAAGVEAIHPGYGFLSENAGFAQACIDAGFVFVGPPPAAIAAMGSKIIAKTRLAKAGVPVLPGYAGAQQDLVVLEREARALGPPLIVKPAAGGGGKGMQIVRQPDAIAAALAAARRLAESAFGDGALLIERYLPEPRHLEVQVFADGHGNVVHLGDRDCSTQRRHQKLIEEAPAPAIPEPVRERLRAAALLVAREIGYVNAGTVEFLYDGREIYFMEMNTRLQVEHTVTEAVTGLDLVEWQLRVAAGEPLSLSQNQVRLTGHAIEARICAEDPERAFLPSAGQLERIEWPSQPAVRVDAGFASGDSVPDCYDSLLGKVVAWAPTRDEAAAALARALDELRCVGVHSNERWLARVLRSARFLEVRHHIAMLDEAGGEFSTPPAPDELWVLAALAAHHQASHGRGAGEPASPWAVADGFTPNLPGKVVYAFHAGGGRRAVGLEYAGGRPVMARVDDLSFAMSEVEVEPERLRAQLGRRHFEARWLVSGLQVHVWIGPVHLALELDDPRLREFAASTASGGLTTPLPGVVSAVTVSVGQAVAAGEILMVIEAMKMEHSITAPYAGTVAAIHFAPGERVPESAALLELTRAAAGASPASAPA